MEVGYRISFRGFRCWPGVVPLLAGMRCSGLYGNFFVAMRAWLGMAANVAIAVIGTSMTRMAHPASLQTIDLSQYGFCFSRESIFMI